MGRLPDSFIQQVLQATDIVDLIAQYVTLKQKGREFVGLCPFHEDKNPSMYVVPAKQIYHCFVCNNGGNVVKFLMEFEQLNFPEAVKNLAERANIPIPREADAPPVEAGMSRTDLLRVTAFAADFFRQQLHGPAGKGALAYARQRGLNDETLERFAIGYAPDRWDALLNEARKRRIAEQQLVATGLVRRRDNGSGCYDGFRNRLMFPIHDLTGRVVAFGGRALSSDERAKYINSPDGPLFDKSSLLYGLHLARDDIRKRDQVVIAEGYLDVIAPSQEGVGNLVAPLGTALTQRHVRILSRYASQAVLIFDADTAGAMAAERALQLFLAQQLHVRVVTIPAGKDPCDYALAEGGQALRELIDAAPDALQYVWDRRWEAFQQAGGNPSQRQKVVEDFLSLVVSSGEWGAIDETRQSHIAQHIAHILNLSAHDLQRQMRRLRRKVEPARAPDRQGPDRPGRALLSPVTAERQILEVLLDEPDLFDHVMERLGPEQFQDAMLQTLAQWVWQLGEQGQLSLESLLGYEELASLSPLMTELALKARQRGQHEETLNEAVATLLERAERQDLQSIKQNGLDDQTLRELQVRLGKGNRRNRPGIQ
jgi:DNA primase